MTPEEALDFLDNIARQAPMNREGHARAVAATTRLKEYIACMSDLPMCAGECCTKDHVQG